MMTIRVRDGSMKLAHQLIAIQHEVNTSYRRGHMRQRGSASRDLAVRTYIRTYVREYTGSINSSSTRDMENGVVYRKLKKDGA